MTDLLPTREVPCAVAVAPGHWPAPARAGWCCYYLFGSPASCFVIGAVMCYMYLSYEQVIHLSPSDGLHIAHRSSTCIRQYKNCCMPWIYYVSTTTRRLNEKTVRTVGTIATCHSRIECLDSKRVIKNLFGFRACNFQHSSLASGRVVAAVAASSCGLRRRSQTQTPAAAAAESRAKKTGCPRLLKGRRAAAGAAAVRPRAVRCGCRPACGHWHWHVRGARPSKKQKKDQQGRCVTRGLVLQLGSKTDRPPNKGHTMYRRCSWVGLVSAAAPVAMCTVGFRAVAMCTVYRQEYNYRALGGD
jgi:hypothetical protein